MPLVEWEGSVQMLVYEDSPERVAAMRAWVKRDRNDHFAQVVQGTYRVKFTGKCAKKVRGFNAMFYGEKEAGEARSESLAVD